MKTINSFSIIAICVILIITFKAINKRLDAIEEKLTPPTYKILDYPDPYKNEVDKEKLKTIERDRILEDQIQQSS